MFRTVPDDIKQRKEELKALIRHVDDLEKLAKENPEAHKKVCKDFLYNAGITTKAGKLRKCYGG